jgi:hypothetical protein
MKRISTSASAPIRWTNEEDIDLCFRTDSVDQAFDYLTEQLGTYALDEPGATL